MSRVAALLLLLVSSASAFAPVVPRWGSALRKGVKSHAEEPKIFKVTLVNEDGEQTIDCASNKTLLDAAEANGISLPFDCRLGSCVACAGKTLEGTVDNSEQFFLNDELLGMGFTLTCVAYPQSDCKVQTDTADEVNALF